MTEHISIDQAQALDAFIIAHPRGHYMQTSMYGKSRPDYEWHGIMLKNATGEIYASASLHSRPIRFTKKRMFYAPRGPVFSDEAGFREIVAEMCRYCKENNGYLLRIDPGVLEKDAATLAVIKDMGFVIDPRDDYSTFIARKVYQTFLTGLDEETLLARFHSKTRYNIRLAQRRGVIIRQGETSELEVFRNMMSETAQRDGFSAKSVVFYKDLLDCFGEDARLLFAEREGKILAGAIQITQGQTSWYVYGCSFNEGREHMPNYLMQWEMIRYALEKGCGVYDFRGVEGDPVPENPHFGLHRFKQGFDAKFVAYAGQMDLVLDRFTNRWLTLAQKLYALIR